MSDYEPPAEMVEGLARELWDERCREATQGCPWSGLSRESRRNVEAEARERELREEMAKMCAVMGWDLPKCASGPVDDAALREMLTKFGLALLGDDPVDYRGDDTDAPVCVVERAVNSLLGGGK